MEESPLSARNLTDGPSGALASQTYRSCFFLASKKTTFRQPCELGVLSAHVDLGCQELGRSCCLDVSDVCKGGWDGGALNTFMSATSLMTPLSVFVSSFASFLQCGSNWVRSSRRCLCLHADSRD